MQVLPLEEIMIRTRLGRLRLTCAVIAGLQPPQLVILHYCSKHHLLSTTTGQPWISQTIAQNVNRLYISVPTSKTVSDQFHARTLALEKFTKIAGPPYRRLFISPTVL